LAERFTFQCGPLHRLTIATVGTVFFFAVRRKMGVGDGDQGAETVHRFQGAEPNVIDSTSAACKTGMVN
jgi:hypothetical protein